MGAIPKRFARYFGGILHVGFGTVLIRLYVGLGWFLIRFGLYIGSFGPARFGSIRYCSFDSAGLVSIRFGSLRFTSVGLVFRVFGRNYVFFPGSQRVYMRPLTCICCELVRWIG